MLRTLETILLIPTILNSNGALSNNDRAPLQHKPESDTAKTRYASLEFKSFRSISLVIEIDAVFRQHPTTNGSNCKQPATFRDATDHLDDKTHSVKQKDQAIKCPNLAFNAKKGGGREASPFFSPLRRLGAVHRSAAPWPPTG